MQEGTCSSYKTVVLFFIWLQIRVACIALNNSDGSRDMGGDFKYWLPDHTCLDRFIMASAPICSPLSCKDQIQVAKKALMQIGRDSINSCLSCHKMCLSSCSACRIGKRHTVYHISEIPLKGKSGERSNSFYVFNLFPLPYRSSKVVPNLKFYSMGIRGKSTSGGGHQRDKHGSNSSGTPAASIEKQLKTLDAYFSKLRYDMNKQLNSCTSASDSETIHSRRQDMINSSSESIGKVTENIDATDGYKAETGLNSLENYFRQLSGIYFCNLCRDIFQENYWSNDKAWGSLLVYLK